MSREERWGNRGIEFSRWHRALKRDDLTWIDIDHMAYCDRCKDPLYIFELARDVGQNFKATTITRQVANGLGVPALLVLYALDIDGEITRFRVRQVAPRYVEDWHVCEPPALAEWIERKHDEHVCFSDVSEAA